MYGSILFLESVGPIRVLRIYERYDVKKPFHRFYNIKIRNKVMMTYILMAFIPVTIFSVYVSSIFLREARKNGVEYTGQMVYQVGYSIDIYIDSISKMIELYSLELDGILANYINYPESYEDVREVLEDKLNNLLIGNNEIAGGFIATTLDTSFSTGMSRISKDPFAEEIWYRNAINKPEEINILSSAVGRNIATNKEYSVDDVFCLSKAITDPDTGAIVGVILLDIKHDIIQQSIDSAKIGKEGYVFITDSKDNIVYAPARDTVYRVNPKWLTGQQGSVAVKILGGSYQVGYQSSSYTGWKTVGVFPFEEVMGSINSISFTLSICIIINIILIMIVSYLLTGAITDQILVLKKLMTRAELGDLSVRFEPLYNDEIGELGIKFNHMINQVEHLIDMVYKEQKNKRNAELKSLQEQIKPHFLYNTLDTISWMARDYKADEIVHLIDALTNMFRIGLSHGKDYVPVSEEIKHVSNYLYIQQIRYKTKLRYELNIPDEVESFMVPKLILQPLVENAIYHGIKTKRGGGTITISADIRNKDELIFCIRDNGGGIPPDRLKELKNTLEATREEIKQKSFGLFYIKERIQLSYGYEYGISIDSVEGEYTEVTINLPVNGRLE